ncbi:hypothetical protein MTR_6g089250 [Medicago truncatula]|uniref:Uncharacterized protein n=1 Tax=Medicago truncatula TaxID=3880 RepID=G7KQD5_MEDTR|nr:hypothetical protein MTR_6g089250 [Medicago truncatula]
MQSEEPKGGEMQSIGRTKRGEVQCNQSKESIGGEVQWNQKNQKGERSAINQKNQKGGEVQCNQKNQKGEKCNAIKQKNQNGRRLNPSSLTSVFLASTEVLEEHCSCGLDRGSANCLAVIVIPVRRFHRSFFRPTELR